MISGFFIGGKPFPYPPSSFGWLGRGLPSSRQNAHIRPIRPLFNPFPCTRAPSPKWNLETKELFVVEGEFRHLAKALGRNENPTTYFYPFLSQYLRGFPTGPLFRTLKKLSLVIIRPGANVQQCQYPGPYHDDKPILRRIVSAVELTLNKNIFDTLQKMILP